MAARKVAAKELDVARFLEALEHPMKAEIEDLRKLILAADRSIQEGIKWNAPSFRTTEYFATFHLRPRDRVTLILHLGAAVRKEPGIAIDDPGELLEWLGKDRARVTFHDRAEIRAKRKALQSLLRRWIAHV